MSTHRRFEIVVVGAGIAGISAAYYLCVEHKKSSVLLIDCLPPMSFTSAQSGDNYRNWWPHPTMAEFTDHSIDLMEEIAQHTSNAINMTRRGYALASRRKNIDDLVADLHVGYGSTHSIRSHQPGEQCSYSPATTADWTTAPNGVDVISNRKTIRNSFPAFDADVKNVIHIRRAGDFSSQQMGQYMLEQISIAGGKRLTARVLNIENNLGFEIETNGSNGDECLYADSIVNAAGPFAKKLASMMTVDLPIENIFHQKIAFEDTLGAVPRAQPFSIDLDANFLGWTNEEREWLGSEPELSWLAGKVAGGTHCRPEGGDNGNWVKLGWAYNQVNSEPQQDLHNEPRYDSLFPEIVMRAASRLQPALLAYTQNFPKRWSHYGGYYCMTKENWPLIGPAGQEGSYVVGALSGYGSMAACAAGSLVARHITGKTLPEYASHLSLDRYKDQALMDDITNRQNTGIL